jgi:hypothetical protein
MAVCALITIIEQTFSCALKTYSAHIKTKRRCVCLASTSNKGELESTSCLSRNAILFVAFSAICSYTLSRTLRSARAYPFCDCVSVGLCSSVSIIKSILLTRSERREAKTLSFVPCRDEEFVELQFNSCTSLSSCFVITYAKDTSDNI